MEFVRIRAGSFHMGAVACDADAEWNELPAVPAAVSQDFFLSTKPVTAGDFSRFLDLPEGEYAARGPLDAANYLSASDADAFVECVNSQKPYGERRLSYCLPSEAEWEYACRAGTTTRFSFGDDPDYAQLREHAWYAENTWHEGTRSPQPPGEKRPNPWGLFDMHGNVWEWTRDGWGLYREIARHGSAARDLTTRVLRGGGWCHDARYLRASDRDHYTPDYRHYYTGMRLAFHVR
ncbi:MAG TPA: formylglycine-generating enzyme family protein [Chthoniobacteraceae bacterium]